MMVDKTMRDKCSGLQIDAIWPVSTKLVPDGGIGIDWSADIGFGQFVLRWGDDGKLHADTEHIDSNVDMRFTKAILKLLANEVIIDV